MEFKSKSSLFKSLDFLVEQREGLLQTLDILQMPKSWIEIIFFLQNLINKMM